MGCGASNPDDIPESKQRGLPKKNCANDWKELRARLPRTRSAEDETKRDALFNQFDVNGNRMLSLAEVDKGCRDFLQLQRLTDDLAPILIRAFNAAKGASNRLGKPGAKPDYVERVEFRLLLVYIYDYFEMWVAFDDIDTSDDRRVAPAEFKAALPLLESWGVKIDDADATFKEIDTNGGGFILFQEFTTWAFNKHLDVDGEENVK